MSTQNCNCVEMISAHDYEPVICDRCETGWCSLCAPSRCDDAKLNWHECPICTGREVDADALLTFAAQQFDFDERQLWLKYWGEHFGPQTLQNAIRDDKHEIIARIAEVAGPNAAACVPELIAIVQDCSTVEARRAGSEALGYIGNAAQPALPLLTTLMQDADWATRIIAASAVYRIQPGHAEAIVRLRSDLSTLDDQAKKSENRLVLVFAIRAMVLSLGHANPPTAEAVELLIQLASDEDWSSPGPYDDYEQKHHGIGDLALRALGNFRTAAEPVLPQMIEAVRRFKSRLGLEAVCEVAPHVLLEELRPLLIEQFNSHMFADEIPNICHGRSPLARLLRRLASDPELAPKVVATLKEALNSAELSRRVTVVAYLQCLSAVDEATRETIVDGMQSDDPDICCAAMCAASYLTGHSEEFIPIVLANLDHSDPDVREQAACSLGEMGKAATEALLKLMEVSDVDANENVRTAAVKAIGQICCQSECDTFHELTVAAAKNPFG